MFVDRYKAKCLISLQQENQKQLLRSSEPILISFYNLAQSLSAQHFGIAKILYLASW
jgi:hypothetical protein